MEITHGVHSKFQFYISEFTLLKVILQFKLFQVTNLIRFVMINSLRLIIHFPS